MNWNLSLLFIDSPKCWNQVKNHKSEMLELKVTANNNQHLPAVRRYERFHDAEPQRALLKCHELFWWLNCLRDFCSAILSKSLYSLTSTELQRILENIWWWKMQNTGLFEFFSLTNLVSLPFYAVNNQLNCISEATIDQMHQETKNGQTGENGQKNAFALATLLSPAIEIRPSIDLHFVHFDFI